MVPKSLRTWFVVHFAVDVVFAVPLLVAPEFSLSLLGWTVVDPLASRLVGAALMGIGLESFLGRNAGREVYLAMLTLKIIWSLSAIIGIGATMVGGGPAMGWFFLAIFAIFFALWLKYWRLLRRE